MRLRRGYAVQKLSRYMLGRLLLRCQLHDCVKRLRRVGAYEIRLPEDFRFTDPSATRLHGSAKPHFAIPTRISCHVALDRAACAPFRKERRMKCINLTNLNRKSGGAQPRDLQCAPA